MNYKCTYDNRLNLTFNYLLKEVKDDFITFNLFLFSFIWFTICIIRWSKFYHLVKNTDQIRCHHKDTNKLKE